MRNLSRLYHYGGYLQWTIERDILNASFTRMGSGFLTKPILQEAVQTHDRINQILTQYRLILESGTPPSRESSLLPTLEAQKSVPIYAHPKDGGNLS